MVALTADRNTPYRDGCRRSFPAKAGVKIFAGALTAIDTSGRAVPGSVSTTLKGVGRCEKQVDNTAGADGDLRVDVSTGVHRFANSTSTDAITAADIKANAYIVDDQTVAKTDGGGTRSVAGVIFDVDALGVWVRFL